MAFLVETGAGLSGANAYLTLDEADAYFDDRFITTWVGSAGQKQAAIIKATDYLDATYRWRGTRLTSTQGLAWPRGGAVDSDGLTLASDAVPEAVKAACAEMALIALNNTLVTNVTGEDRVQRVKAGSVEVEYATGAKDAGTRYAWVDRLLSDVAMSGTGALSRMTTRGW
jgi:hypothetical protein